MTFMSIDSAADFKLSSYQFELPEMLIAAQPLTQRDESKLMVIDRSKGTLHHHFIKDLPQILATHGKYALIANNTKVFRARLLGNRVTEEGALGGNVEFFLLKQRSADGLSWQGLMKSSAKIAPGFKFKIGTVSASVTQREETTSGVLITAQFSENPTLANIGEVPLPPYVVARRKSLGLNELHRSQHQELELYNTVYSQVLGSVAAPTAGRHFTPELINNLRKSGMEWNEITLHVGMGTFKPVTSDDIRDHHMHAETATISPQAASAISHAKMQGRKILAVGTTSARTLEGMSGRAGTAEVDLFIYPGSTHQWKIVDALLTNFHLPGSSLLMMVASFLGSREKLLEIYQEAIRQEYRFYSYGDAMLILE